MPGKINYSSELMTNYKQIEIANPEQKFRALQTAKGYSLLFSLGTDHVFYLIREIADKTSRTGWQKTDLSISFASENNAKYPVKTFEVGQNFETGKITIIAVVIKNGTDFLYISENNSDNEEDWSKPLSWRELNFDDPARMAGFSVRISNIYISQTAGGQLIVADIYRNPNDAVKYVYRYYIDPSKEKGVYWFPQDITTDLEADKTTSCIGRKKSGRVDGIYTLGEIGGIRELLYQPIFNAFSKTGGLSPSSRLLFPANAVPTAIATAAAGDGKYTDLFAACNGALYYFPFDQQNDNDQGICVFTNDLLDGVKTLYAFRNNQTTIVWGVNRALEFFYISCTDEKITASTKWSYPLPILSKVQQVSPYINKSLSVNTFFAHTGENRFTKAVQSPLTTIWDSYDITLPTDESAKALEFNSYTTRITAENEDGEPLAQNTSILLSTFSPKSLYINNRYYALSNIPLSVELDDAGSLNIIEKTDSLKATCLQVHFEGKVTAINPMGKPFSKLKALTSSEGLTKATIRNDYDCFTKSLVGTDISEKQKKAAANTLKKILEIEDSLPDDGSVKTESSLEVVARKRKMETPELMMSVKLSGGTLTLVEDTDIISDISRAIEVAAGDAFKYISDGIDYTINLVKDTANDVWIFLAEIGDKIFRFVIDCAEKVAGAAEAVFMAIKTAIKDVIQFVKFLFDWDDFVRTKDVMKNFFNLHMQENIKSIDGVKKLIQTEFRKVKDDISVFADIQKDGWERGTAQLSKSMKENGKGKEKDSVSGSASSFLMNHLKDNEDKAKGFSSDKGFIGIAGDAVSDLLAVVMNALESQGDIFKNTISQIQKELLDNGKFKNMSFLEIIKKLFGILSYTVINTAENILGLIIDVVVVVLKTAMELFNTPIRIPVLSDILDKILGEEIKISLFDIILMVVAVPATIIYKIANNKAPFTKTDDFSEKIIQAKNLAELRNALNDKDAVVPLGAGSDEKTSKVDFIISPSLATRETIFSICHYFAGTAAIFCAPVVGVAQCFDKTPSGVSDIVFYLGICSTAGEFAAGLFAGLHPLENPTFSTIATILSGVSVAGAITFWALKKKFVDTDNIDKMALWFNGIIACLQIVPEGYHIYELSQKKNTKNRNLTILNNCSHICKHLSKVTAVGAKSTQGKPRIVLAVSSGVLVGGYGVLQIVVGTN